MEFLLKITAQPFIPPPLHKITKTFSMNPQNNTEKNGVTLRDINFSIDIFMGKEGLNLSQVLNVYNKPLLLPLLTFFLENKRPYKNFLLDFISSRTGY